VRATVNNQVVLSRPPEGPLTPYITAFAESMNAQGYGIVSLRFKVRVVADFSRWLKRSAIEVQCINVDHEIRYLRYRARRLKHCGGESAALRHLVDFLQREGVLRFTNQSTCRMTPADRCAQENEQYLHEVRALAQPTIITYMPFVRDFLNERFGDGKVTLGRLRASDVAEL
jgi:integrase/recombinase XerD